MALLQRPGYAPGASPALRDLIGEARVTAATLRQRMEGWCAHNFEAARELAQAGKHAGGGGR